WKKGFSRFFLVLPRSQPQILHRGAQQLSNAPGLGDAAAGGVGRIAVEDLGDGTDSRFSQVSLEAGEALAPLAPALVAPEAHQGGEARARRCPGDRRCPSPTVLLCRRDGSGGRPATGCAARRE